MAVEQAPRYPSPTAVRYGGWEALSRNLAAEAVLAEAELYASGGRRLTVEHGEPHSGAARDMVEQMVLAVECAALRAGADRFRRVEQSTSVTWTFAGDAAVPARSVLLATRSAAGVHNPGSWTVSADDQW